jgi:glycosyltransferase involved in cell wall biosynthesis
MPAVTVIVPACDAEATIGRTLDALSAIEPKLAEVIVVDDASGDDTAAIAEARGARVVRLDQRSGPGAARNAGVAASDSSYLAFTDADCEPTPDWLAAGLAALRGGADLATGPIRPDPRVKVGTYDRTLHAEGPSRLFESANLFVTRELFERLEGFSNPDRVGLAVRRGHFGEDVVFGWRAVRAGARIEHAEGAVVYHAVFPRGPRAYVAERLRLRLFPPLVADVPELRTQLPLRLFLSRRTMRFDLALLAASQASRRRRWMLALALPYVVRDLRVRRPWSPRELRRVLTLALADAVGLGALIYGSARSRSPLL